MRVAVEFRSTSRDNYKDFCKYHPTISITFDQWKNIIYSYNESFKEYILETGEKAKMPFGFGEFSINKKKRKKIVEYKDRTYVNLPVDWQKSKEKGKRIYNFNYHSEGWFFGWMWFRRTATFRHSDLWYFRPSRLTSRLLAHYIKTGDKYQSIYREWTKRVTING